MNMSLILCSDMHMDIEKANQLISNSNQEWVSDYTLADIIIIFTCAFGSKKEYSMYVIADVIRNAKPGSRVIATGCLAKINEAELNVIPNLEVKSFEEVKLIVGNSYSSKQKKIWHNKVIISNGCLKKCSYCLYSLLEKTYHSKPIDAVLTEVEDMYQVEDTIYITGAHETSDYGVDLYGKRKFDELLEQICKKFPDCNYVIGWFHPAGLTDQLIDVIAKYKNIVQIMIHLQHVDNQILKDMNRPCFEWTEERILKLHKVRPDLSISTEFIVGFPGETEDKFYSLCEYIKSNQHIFDDIGVASYEPVLNTKAAQLANLPDYSIRNERMEFIKREYGATAYSAPIDFKPVLSYYLEASYSLALIPNMCIEAKFRQIYPYIAGTDTEFKMKFLENFPKVSFEMFQEISRNEKKYTAKFREWLLLNIYN